MRAFLPIIRRDKTGDDGEETRGDFSVIYFFADEFFQRTCNMSFMGGSPFDPLWHSPSFQSLSPKKGVYSSSCMSAFAPLTPHLPSSFPPPPKQKRIFLPRRMSERMEPSVRVLFKMKRGAGAFVLLTHPPTFHLPPFIFQPKKDTEILTSYIF